MQMAHIHGENGKVDMRRGTRAIVVSRVPSLVMNVPQSNCQCRSPAK